MILTGFSGNTNLIYSLIRSKVVFYQLANLPEDSYLLLTPHARNTSHPGITSASDTNNGKREKEREGRRKKWRVVFHTLLERSTVIAKTLFCTSKFAASFL